MRFTRISISRPEQIIGQIEKPIKPVEFDQFNSVRKQIQFVVSDRFLWVRLIQFGLVLRVILTDVNQTTQITKTHQHHSYISLLPKSLSTATRQKSPIPNFNHSRDWESLNLRHRLYSQITQNPNLRHSRKPWSPPSTLISALLAQRPSTLILMMINSCSYVY